MKDNFRESASHIAWVIVIYINAYIDIKCEGA